jgi:hypothetical protein
MRRAGLLTGTVALLLVAFAGVAVAATITGDARDNSLIGTKRADTIRGLGGDDRLAGRGGDDRLLGRGGNDAIYGGRAAIGSLPVAAVTSSTRRTTPTWSTSSSAGPGATSCTWTR